MNKINMYLLLFIFLNSSCVSTNVQKITAEEKESNKRVGIVFMHGKGGNPNKYIPNMADAFRSQGYLVVTPLMPWTDGAFDHVYSSETESILDEKISKLRSRGAQVIIVGGHSAGGAASVIYGAGHHDIQGVMMIGPPKTLPYEIKKLGPDTPILWVWGTHDKDIGTGAESYGFRSAPKPKHILNKKAEVKAGHLETPDASIQEALAWIKQVVQHNL